MVKNSNIVPWYEKKVNVDEAYNLKASEPRPSVYNLADNDWLDGQSIAFVHVDFKTGELGDFVVAGGVMLNPDGTQVPLVIITGSEDVYARLYQHSEKIEAGTPVVGTLRSAGRAWFLD